MELDERLSYLENVRDWQSLTEELERGIASQAANPAKARTSVTSRLAAARIRPFIPITPAAVECNLPRRALWSGRLSR